MVKIKDVFGTSLWDYFNRRRKYRHIIERDDGYCDTQLTARYFWPYKKWPAIEKKALKYAKGKILDMGCGAGRHAIWLQNKGHDITGVDFSPLNIKICRLLGLKDARIMNLFDLKLKEKFDTILLMFNGFGLAGTIPETKKFLKSLYKITSKKGIILASTYYYTQTKNPAHLNYHKNNRNKGLPPCQIKMRHIYRNQKGPWHHLLMVLPKEAKDIVKGTGWKISKFIIIKDSPEYFIMLKK
jgi:SAM-dependent methyltransferase